MTTVGGVVETVTCAACTGLGVALASGVARDADTVRRDCRECAGHGRRRAQLVLTVANLETGVIASANVVPGSVEPSLVPAGGWRLELAPILTELAERAGVAAATLREVSAPDRPVDPDGELSLFLGRGWGPDLSTDDRHARQARALAGRSSAPWLVYLGESAAPEPPDPDRQLARLCQLADQLCLDLVIEARRTLIGGLAWDIRYELPGTHPPAHSYGYHDDLPAALARTTINAALHGLDERSRAAPAHYLNPPLTAAAPDTTDVVELLQRRIVADCEHAPAAQAIWRDQHWQHTSLRPGGSTTTIHADVRTGRTFRKPAVIYLRNQEPPPPAYLAGPIPHTRCPDCAGTAIRNRQLPCFTCRGSGRLYHGAVVTITNLNARTVHLNWRADDPCPAPATRVGTQPGGKAILRLPPRFQLRSWAAVFDVPPEHLTEIDDGQVIDHDLREGVLTLPGPGTDPVGHYLGTVGRGRPGARLLVCAAAGNAPPLAHLARLALGLGLALEICAEHRPETGEPHKPHGTRWEIDLVDPASPVDTEHPPLWHSLPEAITRCLKYVSSALRAAVPADPSQPIRVPQQPQPPDDIPGRAVPDLESAVRQLAERHPGEPVVARLGSTGYRTWPGDG